MYNPFPNIGVAAAALILAGAGFLFQFWPLGILAVVLAALGGSSVTAVLLGLVLDLLWGAPQGLEHYLYLPITLCAVVALLARSASIRFFLPRALQDNL